MSSHVTRSTMQRESTNQHYDHEDVKGQIKPTFEGINSDQNI